METIIKSILKEKNNKELLLGNLATQDKNNKEKSLGHNKNEHF